MDDEKQKSQDSILNNPDFGAPSRPIHISQKSSWSDRTKEMEDYIRDNVPFEGKFQSYLKSYQIIIPEQFRKNFSSGGVVSVSTEKHLLLFGTIHWSRFSRLLAKEVGLSPDHNSAARHIYSNMYRFDKLNENGTIDIPLELVKYADLNEEIAIIGLMYHAEIHDKKTYLASEKPDEKHSLLERFKKMRFN